MKKIPEIIIALATATGIAIFGFLLSSPRLEAPSKPAKARNPNKDAVAIDEGLLPPGVKGARLKPVTAEAFLMIIIDKTSNVMYNTIAKDCELHL